MARTEARISVEIWDDPQFLALSPAAQRMFMFLLSQRDLAHTGVLPLRDRRWAKSAAGMTLGDVESALKELAEARFVVVDEDAMELLIRSFMRGDKVYRQPQVMRAARDQLAMVTSQQIRAELAVELRRIAQFAGLHEASAQTIASMLESLGHPAHDPAGHPARTLPEGSTQGDQLRPGERGEQSVLPVGDSPSPDPRSSDPDPRTTTSSSSARETRGTTSRGTRLPENFGISSKLRAWAIEEVPGFDVDREHMRFRDYWRAKPGKDGTKVDWDATWRNWMRKAADDRGSAGHGGRTSPNSNGRRSGALSGQNRHHDSPDRTPRIEGVIASRVLAETNGSPT